MRWISDSTTSQGARLFFFILIILSTLTVDVMAQEPGDENYRDCSEESLQEMSRENLSSSAPAASTSLLPSGLTPEEAAEVRARIYTVRQNQIAQFHDMLGQMPAGYSRRADVLFRMAEAYWAVHEADYMATRAEYNACIDDWFRCLRNEECVEPIPDYSLALDQYREVLRDHPDYSRIDEVIFRLGDGLIQADQSAEGVQFLTRLVNNYSDSRFIPDALFLLGEHFFNNDLLIAARNNYTGVQEYRNSDYYNFAIYKTAWIDMNEDMWRDAVQRFQTVISNLDEAEARGEDTRFDLRAQSLNDMLVAWTEIDDGWVEARRYLMEQEGEDTARRKLLAMSDLYDEKGKDEERVALISWFIDTYPNDSQMPTWMEYVSDSLTKIGQWDRYEDTIRDFVRILDPNATWAIVNNENTRELSMARRFSEESFLGIILRNYQECTRLNRNELCLEVATDYVEFFRRWPDSQQVYEQRFNFAEVLYYNVEDYPEAGEQYLEVVRMDTEGQYAHDAIVGALQSFDDLMKTEFPDIDEETESLTRETAEALCEESAVDLPHWSSRYVEVVEYFAELFPEDELIPVASWRAAELYRRTFQLGNAALRFETIIEHHPTHRFADVAASSAFYCFYCVEEWGRIEYWARFLLENNPGDNPDLNPDRLRNAIAFSINEQVSDLLEAGEEFDAAEKMLALYEEFPNSEFSPPALFNAAAIYERARRVDTAIATYNMYLDAYPEDENVAEARFTLGLIYDSQANFAEAANWFETVDAYPDFEDRSDAVYNAAILREALSDFDRAIELYNHYRELEPDNARSSGLVLLIAKIEEDRGNLDTAYAQYEQFRTEYPEQKAKVIASTVMQARIRTEQGRSDEALELYRDAYGQFGSGVLLFDDAGRPTEWETSPGWQIEDPAERSQALVYAAESRFHIAELDWEACQAITLPNPTLDGFEAWGEVLGARGTALDASQRTMFEVFMLNNADWAVAATSRIAELYQKFYNDLYNIDAFDFDQCLDDGYTYDNCDDVDQQISGALYDIMSPLEIKAVESFTEALTFAHENDVYTEWTDNAVENMMRVDRSIRVSGEEGVNPNNTGLVYTGAPYITDIQNHLAELADLQAQEEARIAAERQRLEAEGYIFNDEEGSTPPPLETEETAPEDATGEEDTQEVESSGEEGETE